MDIYKIKRVYPNWDRCELHLQHTSRKTGNYWLYGYVVFYSGKDKRKTTQLGPGSKEEGLELIKRLKSFGYQYARKRFNIEWEIYVFKMIN